MARRRMISQELISDEHFNNISLEAQNIFVRMLSVSDDCGVVPANIYRLNVLINTPKKTINHLEEVLSELVESGLGCLFNYRDERFFAFKPSSFEDYQSYILKKATKSEYLRIPKDDFTELSKKFQEIPRNSIHICKSAVSTVESIKQQVESKEQIVESNPFVADFDLFWKSYPRKTGKKPCEKSFNKIKWTKELFEVAVFAIQKQIEAGMLNNGQYTPHPATWLDQERWTDSIIIKESENGTGNGFSKPTGQKKYEYQSGNSSGFQVIGASVGDSEKTH
jgi:hypothetical protein